MYDLIIIGAGTAGMSAYKEAIKTTQNVLLINQGRWTTTCAQVGCMPSKLLIAAAQRSHAVHTADRVGLKASQKIRTDSVMKVVQKKRDVFTQSVLKQVKSWKKHHKLTGQAYFIDPTTVEVAGKRYQAKAFIIAVGSTPQIAPAWQNALHDKLLTTDQIFELDRIPKRLTVVGAGAIGLELAQAMSRLGCKVTVLARKRRIGLLTFPALQELAIQILSHEIDFKFGTSIEQVKPTKNKMITVYSQQPSSAEESETADLSKQGQLHQIKSDYLLAAIGRRSLLSTLRLQAIDEQFSDIDQLPICKQTKQLGRYPIFVVGDAATDLPVLHQAAHEGRMVVPNALTMIKRPKAKPKPLPKLTSLQIVFIAPEMAIAGQSYQQLVDEKIEFITGYVSYADQGRARVLAENKGALALFVDQHSQCILGAELFCPDAEHLAHLLAWEIDQNITLTELLAKPFYHPTLEEGIRTAARDAARQLNIVKE